MTDITPQQIDRETQRRLHEWGRWRFTQDDPQVGFPHLNILAKQMKHNKTEWDTPQAPRDWTEAEKTDAAVRAVQLVAPDAYHALCVRYHFDPEMSDDTAHRRAWELAAYCRRIGKEVSAMKLRADVVSGRRLVAMALVF